MIRSASASMARPSSVVKNSQGPSFAADGGLPPFGSQGSAPEMVRADEFDAVAISRAALDNSIDLRETSRPSRVSKVDSRFLALIAFDAIEHGTTSSDRL